jgi:hypothetical protein
MARYNVVAAFPDTKRAKRAVERLQRSGVKMDNVRLLRPGMNRDRDRMSELRAEMQDEVAEGFGGPGIGFMTPSQAKGATKGIVLGTAIGVIVGAVIGVVWAFVGHSAIHPLLRFVIAFVPFAVAGATAGFIAGGAMEPRAEASFDPTRDMGDARLAAERDTIVAVHVNDPAAAERAQRVMEELGAERVDAVNADGTPLPPQSEHPRPADPPDRWWWPGRASG